MQKLAALKSRVIFGRVIDLHPFSPEFAADIARLRNQERARYFLSQQFELTEEAQVAWMQQYVDRPDEINFVVTSKSGNVVGTFGLYDFQDGCMELGRVVFDLERVKGGVPYALESLIMVMDIAYEMLGLSAVSANIREDNYNLIKFVQSMGFCKEATCLIREQPYLLLRAKSTLRPYIKYNKYIDAWMEKYLLAVSA